MMRHKQMKSMNTTNNSCSILMFYYHFQRGVRICGAGSCPTWNARAFESNVTEEYNWFTFSGTIPITLLYVILASIALVLASLSQQVDSTFKYEHFRGVADTLLLASPMAFFIGTEQGYVIGGFTRVSNSTRFQFPQFLLKPWR